MNDKQKRKVERLYSVQLLTTKNPIAIPASLYQQSRKDRTKIGCGDGSSREMKSSKLSKID